MNINEKTKGIISGLLIFLVISLTIVTLLYPEYLGNPHSLKSIESTKEELIITQNELVRNEINIEKLISERDRTAESSILTTLQAEDIKSRLDIAKLDYHIPSLLVTLEQAALDLKITAKQFYIEYDQIKTTKNTFISERPDREGTPDGPRDNEKTPETDPSAPAAAEPVEEVGVVPVEENIKPSLYGEEITKGDPTVAIAYDTAPNIPGIGVTTIPLKLIGVSYGQAREYILFLDKLDFIEPSFADLYSSGEETSLVILIHVFHKEGGPINE